jgi:predicted dehydrogenase
MISRGHRRGDHRGGTLAVIGGGRWGRVMVSVLGGMNIPFERVAVVTRSNADAVARQIASLPSEAATRFMILPSLDALLETGTLRAAVVANAAREHFATAHRLLDRGIDILVEKPLVLSTDEARTLLQTAVAGELCLVPGLQYRFCSYLEAFSKRLRVFGPWRSFSLEWADASGEVRYGEAKAYDASITVAEDVMPHVWTILHTVLGPQVFALQNDCKIAEGGRVAEFVVGARDGRGRVTLERDAPARRRVLAFEDEGGRSIQIDFTQEPGTITQGSKSETADPDWARRPRPLTLQFEHFFSCLESGRSPWADQQACLQSVEFTQQTAASMRSASATST